MFRFFYVKEATISLEESFGELSVDFVFEEGNDTIYNVKNLEENTLVLLSIQLKHVAVEGKWCAYSVLNVSNVGQEMIRERWSFIRGAQYVYSVF